MFRGRRPRKLFACSSHCNYRACRCHFNYQSSFSVSLFSFILVAVASQELTGAAQALATDQVLRSTGATHAISSHESCMAVTTKVIGILWATADAMVTAIAIAIVMAMATAMAIVVAMAQAITANDRTKMQKGDRYTHMQCCCQCLRERW